MLPTIFCPHCQRERLALKRLRGQQWFNQCKVCLTMYECPTPRASVEDERRPEP